MKIFYGICGEGLGHATRAHAVIQKLEADVHIFTWGEAYQYFKSNNYLNLHLISGLPWGRDSNNKIKLIPSIKNLIHFCQKYENSFQLILKEYEKQSPDLFITDYEPIIPRISNYVKSKCISIDNQHRFNCNLNLPFFLNVYKNIMHIFNDILTPTIDHSIVSTFHYKLIPNKKHITITNSIIRNYFDDIKIENKNFVLVYYKKSCGDRILDLLSFTNEKVKVYNAPKDITKYSNFEYFPFSNEQFIKDLAGCKCVISSAGNQLIGEAIYLKKPLLVIPEPNQPEQLINGFYVNQMQVGDYCSLNNLDLNVIRRFLNTRYSINQDTNGIQQVIDTIKSFNGKK